MDLVLPTSLQCLENLSKCSLSKSDLHGYRNQRDESHQYQTSRPMLSHACQHHNREAEFLSTKPAPRLLARFLVEPAIHAVRHIRWSVRGRLECFPHSLELGVTGVCLHRRRARGQVWRSSRRSERSRLCRRTRVCWHDMRFGCLDSLCCSWLAGLLSVIVYMAGW
jgi:hypothetical protein